MLVYHRLVNVSHRRRLQGREGASPSLPSGSFRSRGERQYALSSEPSRPRHVCRGWGCPVSSVGRGAPRSENAQTFAWGRGQGAAFASPRREGQCSGNEARGSEKWKGGGCPETGPEAGDTPSRHVQPAASRRLPPHTHSSPPRAPLAGRSPTLASELTWCAGGGVVLGRSSSSAPKTGRLASRALGSRAPSLSPDLQTVVLLCHRPAERGMYPSPSVRHLQGMVQ